jgi:hypothetical protein
MQKSYRRGRTFVGLALINEYQSLRESYHEETPERSFSEYIYLYEEDQRRRILELKDSKDEATNEIEYEGEKCKSH